MIIRERSRIAPLPNSTGKQMMYLRHIRECEYARGGTQGRKKRVTVWFGMRAGKPANQFHPLDLLDNKPTQPSLFDFTFRCICLKSNQLSTAQRNAQQHFSTSLFFSRLSAFVSLPTQWPPTELRREPHRCFYILAYCAAHSTIHATSNNHMHARSRCVLAPTLTHLC
jgi:hypothetical protein